GYAKQTGLLTLAEDSGLCCDALEGAPGIYSARFSGLDKDDHANNLKVLRLLEKMPDNCRGAYYKSAVAIASPEKVFGTVSGEVHGFIHKHLTGTQGFGYDTLFYYPPFGKTFGDVPSEMKYQVSHRFKALQKARLLLENIAQNV
nr:non-canonical purine NTP pyrophosphatase [Candidatus Omnitrophota bacterium]